jgi:NADH-quinone oxidoreductase subunit D
MSDDARLKLKEEITSKYPVIEVTDKGHFHLPIHQLIEIMTELKNSFGFDYLANVTAVDYPDHFHVVYDLCRTGLADMLHIIVQVNRENPQIPSMVPIWGGAVWQEREVYDLMGIVFTGHPDLRRILLSKIGRIILFAKTISGRAEEIKTFCGRVDKTMPVSQEEFVLNMGPQHPSTHGVFRIILTLDGETVVKADPVPGYLHRGIEKLAESRTYTQVIPYTDRLDYLASMLMNWGYVHAVEKLMEIEVPLRAEYIRVIVGELARISSHLVATGAMAGDLGGLTGFIYTFRDREEILDLFEMVSGSRLTVSYMRIGGVARDLSGLFISSCHKFLDKLSTNIQEYNGLITGNEIFERRTKKVGILSAAKAIDMSISGPVLRASGVNHDLRKARPYGVYSRFDFDVPLGTQGDCFDRFYVRILEMAESVKIIRQALNDLPEGPILAKVSKIIKPPVGETYAEIESSKGIMGVYIVSDGSTKPYRVHFRRPSLSIWVIWMKWSAAGKSRTL